MLTKTRQHISRALTTCCVVLWLAGSLSTVQGNLLPQWSLPHCPSGQTQHGQESHSHCAWHCGGLDVQSGGGQGEVSTDTQVSRVWSLGDICIGDAACAGEFPPRGPPQPICRIA
ncbi:MAG TPA: hypothetical protein PKD12_19280 [Nitrospira sp.]|nr:hypothetical protein [Nitrospira sp.]